MVSCNVLHTQEDMHAGNFRDSLPYAQSVLTQYSHYLLPESGCLSPTLCPSKIPCWSHRLQLLWRLTLNVWWVLLERAVQHLTCRLRVLGHEAAGHLGKSIYNPLLEMQPDTFSWHLSICLFTLFTAGLINEKEMRDIQKSSGFYRAQTDCVWSNPS